MYESADKSDWHTTTQYMAAIMIFSDTSYNLAGPATGIWTGIISQGITSFESKAHWTFNEELVDLQLIQQHK